ncbi:MAG TPA: BlaI/MecI/CopY family transcriptional regulator [Kineosporiaceae bacterium]
MVERRRPGALESSVIRILWDAGRPLSATEVHRAFPPAGAPAFTTVLTVLQRLEAKQRVTRSVSDNGTLVFAARQSESGHAAETMLAALLATQDRSAALLRFAGSLEAEDVDVLRRALGEADGPGTPE